MEPRNYTGGDVVPRATGKNALISTRLLTARADVCAAQAAQVAMTGKQCDYGFCVGGASTEAQQ